jgi:hypothetical protein
MNSSIKQKSPQALAASAIRKELKDLKLNIKFKVQSDSAAAMTAVRITLINPSPVQVKIVKEIANKYQYSTSNIQNNKLPEVTHVVVFTEYDDELKQQVLDYTVNYYKIKEDVSIYYMHKQYVIVNENFGKEILSDLYYNILNGNSGNFWSHR